MRFYCGRKISSSSSFSWLYFLYLCYFWLHICHLEYVQLIIEEVDNHQVFIFLFPFHTVLSPRIHQPIDTDEINVFSSEWDSRCSLHVCRWHLWCWFLPRPGASGRRIPQRSRWVNSGAACPVWDSSCKGFIYWCLNMSVYKIQQYTHLLFY